MVVEAEASVKSGLFYLRLAATLAGGYVIGMEIENRESFVVPLSSRINQLVIIVFNQVIYLGRQWKTTRRET